MNPNLRTPAATASAHLISSRFCPFFFFLFMFLGAVQGLFASGYGNVSGFVTDPGGNPVQDAMIRVTGTSYRASTDRQGVYRLTGVPAGEVELRVSYLGFQPIFRSVRIEEGRTLTVHFSLQAQDLVYELDDFAVQAYSGDETAAALSQQRAAHNITNVIASDAIGNFPDVNAAEALQRLPGVSIEGQRGEGRFIIVRGAAPNYNSVAMDGAAILSSEDDGRTVSLDIFPAEQIARIELTKAITPDLPGDSVGGRVNLVSKRAFDTGKRRINANAFTSFNDINDTWGYRTGVTYSDVFGENGDWGLQLSAGLTKRVATEQSITLPNLRYRNLVLDGREVAIPIRLIHTQVDIERLRQSYGATVERRFGTKGYFFIRGINNQFTEDNTRPLHQLNFNENLFTDPVFDPEGRLVSVNNSRMTGRRQSNTRTFDDTFRSIAAGGEWYGSDSKLSFQTAYSVAKNTQDSVRGEFVTIRSDDIYPIDFTDLRFPVIGQPVADYLLDPNNFVFNNTQVNDRQTTHDEWSASVDYQHMTRMGSIPFAWKAGAAVRVASRDRYTNEMVYPGYAPGNTDRLRVSDPRVGFYLGDAEFLSGRYTFGPQPSDWGFTRFFEENPSYFATRRDNIEEYDATEDIYAAYLMGTWSFSRLTLLAGVRAEHTKVGFDVRSGMVERPPEAGEFDPTGSYSNLLPSIHLRYEATDAFVLRFAWSSSIARPEFNRLAPFETILVDQISGDINISRGNPDLKAVESFNLDLMAEYYLDHGGILSAGIFYKELDGPIYRSIIGTDTDDIIVTIDSFFNGGKAELIGVEFNYQTQFHNLPGFWSGFGFMINGTLTSSKVDVPQRPGERFPLFRQSKSIGNVALSYDKYKWSGRLAFNWRSNFLRIVGTNILTDDYEGDFKRFDLLLGYKINRSWRVNFEINNLTNEPELQHTGGPQRPTFYALTGRTFSLGVLATF